MPRWSRRTWSDPAGADEVVDAVPRTSAVSPVTASAGPSASPLKPLADGSVGVIPSPDSRVGAGCGVSDGPAAARVRGQPSTQSSRSSSMGRRLMPKVVVSHGFVRSIAWYAMKSRPSASVTTAWWPAPTKRLPFCVSTIVPPTRDVSRGVPSASTNGPSGERDRPAKTE